MTFPNARDVFRRYLLGKAMEEEAREIEEAIACDYNLRQELETAEEELIADYVVGNLREEDRVKFEAELLSSEERVAKLKFAETWVEKGGSICLDLSSPLRRYALGAFMTLDEEIEVEEKLLFDKGYQEQLEGVQDELLIAYFNGRLPMYEKGLFEINYLVSDRMVGKLRFAHIMRESVKRADEDGKDGGRSA